MVGSDFDHVALAYERAFDGLDRYRGDLGGTFLGGSIDPGFYWAHVRFANGMRVELLEPAEIARDDFLRRFLDRSGAGPHHLTFKVPDIEYAIERVRAAGFEPARINLAYEGWREIFLHPKQSFGIVVQFAETSGGSRPKNAGDGLPTARNEANASLERVVHSIANLDAALELFSGILAGQAVAEGDDGGRWVELAWPGAGRLRLWQPSDPDACAWLGKRVGRLHHLAFSLRDPAAVRNARPLVEGVFEIAPTDNHGTRLRLTHEL